MAQVPAIPPPSGITPDFDNPQSQKGVLLVVNGISISLMVICSVLQFYAKMYIIEAPLGLDDAANGLAVLGSISQTALSCYLIKHGLGVHLWDIRADDFTPKAAHDLDALNLVYGPTAFFVRLSLVLLYFRVFSSSRSFRYLAISILVSQTLFFLIDLAVACSAHSLCVSIKSLQDHLCNTISNVVIVQSALSVAMDLLVLALPITRVMKLRLSLSKKLVLIALFSTGFIACGVSFGRLVVYSRNANSLDIFWVMGSTATLSILEINIGIICGAALSFPAIFRAYAKSFRRTRARVVALWQRSYFLAARVGGACFKNSFTAKIKTLGGLVIAIVLSLATPQSPGWLEQLSVKCRMFSNSCSWVLRRGKHTVQSSSETGIRPSDNSNNALHARLNRIRTVDSWLWDGHEPPPSYKTGKSNIGG